MSAAQRGQKGVRVHYSSSSFQGQQGTGDIYEFIIQKNIYISAFLPVQFCHHARQKVQNSTLETEGINLYRNPNNQT
jgi:hypothetical protein